MYSFTGAWSGLPTDALKARNSAVATMHTVCLRARTCAYEGWCVSDRAEA